MITQFIFIIGSPRSGTSFLTDYIGNYTDYKYNEPWKTHHIETPRQWVFPSANNIVFKYCENWRNLHVLLNLYPKSIYAHVWRDPDNVVNSMAYPKSGSWPERNLYGGYKGEEKLKLCMQRWYSNMMHSLSVYNIIPRQYTEIRYEDPSIGLLKLANKIKMPIDLDELKFNNKNTSPNINWDLNEPAKNLRNLIKDFNGKCLAEWINKKRPKLLQRVVL